MVRSCRALGKQRSVGVCCGALQLATVVRLRGQRAGPAARREQPVTPSQKTGASTPHIDGQLDQAFHSPSQSTGHSDPEHSLPCTCPSAFEQAAVYGLVRGDLVSGTRGLQHSGPTQLELSLHSLVITAMLAGYGLDADDPRLASYESHRSTVSHPGRSTAACAASCCCAGPAAAPVGSSRAEAWLQPCGGRACGRWVNTRSHARVHVLSA